MCKQKIVYTTLDANGVRNDRLEDSFERLEEYLCAESIIDTYLETSHSKSFMGIMDHLLSEELRHKLSKKTENMLN